jgi:hypothetical protein
LDDQRLSESSALAEGHCSQALPRDADRARNGILDAALRASGGTGSARILDPRAGTQTAPPGCGDGQAKRPLAGEEFQNHRRCATRAGQPDPR